MVSPSFSHRLLKYGVVVLQSLVMLLASAASMAEETASAQSIIHGLDYLAVDYPGAVADGKVVNEDEYAEQKEIAAHTRSLLQSLPPSEMKITLQQRMEDLRYAINAKAPGEQVVKLSREMISLLLEKGSMEAAPSNAPDLAQAKQLYQAQCSGCHGAEGFGDGPQAMGLEPPPVNFHDVGRAQQRSLLGLYNTISLGVEGTAMQPFTNLSTEERWALAFYVSNFSSSAADKAAGEQLWQQDGYKVPFSDLKSLTQPTMQEVQAKWGDKGVQLMGFLRQEPELLQNPATTPLTVSLDYLHASVSDYRDGNYKSAYNQAVAAYLEGFELVETKLNTMAPDLRTTIEQEMMAYRSQIKAKAPTSQVEQQYQTLTALLDRARSELQADYASPFVSFFAAALILLREGLEAILVLAAIIALLVKGGRHDAVRYIHAGWIVALLLGVFTWFVAEYLFDVSGASREITEGVTALVAAGMLLYVGFWLHNQSHSQRWQQFIRDKISNTLGTGTLWGLTFVAFMAVYREIFETILFYRSMWMSAQPVEHNYLISGIISAAAMLVLLAWLVMKVSVRLPLKRFFKINTVLMFLLAVIFAGKGVAALQEAGTFPLDPVNFIRVDMLGIYPNLESLGAQFLLLAGVSLWWLYGYMRSKRVDSMGV